MSGRSHLTLAPCHFFAFFVVTLELAVGAGALTLDFGAHVVMSNLCRGAHIGFWPIAFAFACFLMSWIVSKYN